ncbi:DIE2/ALG10 family-domain-containing protein [Coniochaeta sp. 2T2.1]|nr:DIE2/ALG10 family-domain-containing protein [Coniochaeta sp. 2T2.1]
MFNLPVDSPVPETAILGLLQGWRFLSGRSGWGFYLLAWFIGSPWLNTVTSKVSAPYLDEVFHIPQAQAYCEGKFGVWDDKITTPPGLYLLAAVYHKVFRNSVCSVYSLRRMNLLGVVLIHLVASSCRQRIEGRGRARTPFSAASPYSYHTGVNIALFPVLYFFSALFYTDVYSALFVLLAYENHLVRLSSGTNIINDVWTVLLGASTLLMRQTNVFWVVVYMGGLEAVHAIRHLKPAAVKTPELTTLWSVVKFYAGRYSVGDIHDPPLTVSYPDDWLFCGVSIVIAAVCNPVRVIKQIWPYIGVAAIFAGAVAWNGGVVLGDKSNHVATIHLAQMLYLWPLFAFFSAPLLIPSFIDLVYNIYLSLTTKKTQPTPTPAPSSSPAKSTPLKTIDFLIRNLFYPVFLLSSAALALAIVRYNTIVHPFTLADNRHYMFYVFRYTILRSLAVRYSLVGGYVLSAYLVWSRLAGCRPPPTTPEPEGQERERIYINRPFAASTSTTPAGRSDYKTAAEPRTALSPSPTTPPSTSTALLWLLTTALSLVSAPLVEPRYFILPWVFWRLLVPAWPTPNVAVPLLRWLNQPLVQKFDLLVALETVWFVGINLATMWVFLSYPYQWKGVDGKVMDEARWQRFMW